MIHATGAALRLDPDDRAHALTRRDSPARLFHRTLLRTRERRQFRRGILNIE